MSLEKGAQALVEEGDWREDGGEEAKAESVDAGRDERTRR
jgi:hypothetical protein